VFVGSLIGLRARDTTYNVGFRPEMGHFVANHVFRALRATNVTAAVLPVAAVKGRSLLATKTTSAQGPAG
jgi:hypothetical protein